MLKNVHILYADDDPQILQSLEYMTKQFGWTGDLARSASEVIEKVNENCTGGGQCYDAVITAVRFFNEGNEPSITGVTAAKAIRKIRENVPIFFISSHNNPIIREEIRRVEGQLMVKPLDTANLFKRVSQMIRWYRETQSSRYEGEDRRRASINFSDQFRRKTDQELVVPERLDKIIREVAKAK